MPCHFSVLPKSDCPHVKVWHAHLISELVDQLNRKDSDQTDSMNVHECQRTEKLHHVIVLWSPGGYDIWVIVLFACHHTKLHERSLGPIAYETPNSICQKKKKKRKTPWYWNWKQSWLTYKIYTVQDSYTRELNSCKWSWIWIHHITNKDRLHFTL